MSDYSKSIYLEGWAEAKDEWQTLLAKAIHMLKGGKNDDEILKDGVDKDTLELARTCA